MTKNEYYNDSSNFGNYQYVLITDLINDYMMSRDSDDFTSTVPRYKLVYQVKRGVRELYYDVLSRIKAIELDLSTTLKVTLPPDFVNHVRISWVDENGILHPMATDKSMSIAEVYLQENNFDILFDSNGDVLTSNDRKNVTEGTRYDISNIDFLPNKDNSKSFNNGKFRIDSESGLIHFSSDVVYKSIVLEYISDGLYSEDGSDENIKIHKFAESTLLDYVYYQLIKNRRNVPANEKQRARKEFYNSKRITKRRINSLNMSDILQVFKGDSKWIK